MVSCEEFRRAPLTTSSITSSVCHIWLHLCSAGAQVLPDADDERILEVAAQCGAMIVTHNIKDFAAAEKLGVPVRTPAELLKMIREGW
ncbi:MAG: DUF5615 family PIN-like protein [Acidobacteriia bacterium]|nr:DUF5615 family PIN-like protein [Terriglobia bacterium]MBV8903059.1 DUF5615 family PIN-like protein [Terriglobia bacterium]